MFVAEADTDVQRKRKRDRRQICARRDEFGLARRSMPLIDSMRLTSQRPLVTATTLADKVCRRRA